MKSRLIIISNERRDGDAPGQIDGFELLVEAGLLASVKVFSPSNLSRPKEHGFIVDELKRGAHDFLLVLTPKIYPSSKLQFEQIVQANRGKPIIYWEGDAWGLENASHLAGRKPITDQMKWWLTESSVVFTHAAAPQINEFEKHGAKKVIHIPQTYCHVQFSGAEKYAPTKKFVNDGILIGSNLSRIPGITGLPGSFSRLRLAYMLKLKHGSQFKIYGKNWIPRISEGVIPYSNQSEIIRNFRISVNWDHYPNYENYTSDRFPISLVSGRAHLTTLHNNSNDFPNEDMGVFRVATVDEAIEKYEDILALGDSRLFQIGLEAWGWSRFRLSHRVAARFIMSQVTSDVPKVDFEPWFTFR